MKPKVLVILGPTAVGKTKYALEIAKELDGEILSCDSMQLYKYMDIGSAKPTPEEQREVRHHLVDEIDPKDDFSVAKYSLIARDALKDITSRGMLPIVSGGTGLYLNSILYEMDFSSPPPDESKRDELYKIADNQGALHLHAMLEDLDPEAASRIHPNNVKKVVRAIEAASEGGGIEDFSRELPRNEDYDFLLLGLTRERELLYDRINRRVDIMMEQGLIDEVKALLARGLESSDISMKGIGYKEIIGYLEGEYDLDEAVRLIKRNSRHLAKRQFTWFNRYKDAVWFDISDEEREGEYIREIIKWCEARISK